MTAAIRVVSFDVGATLGSFTFDSSGAALAFHVYHYIPSILRELKEMGVRIGLISETGEHLGSTVNDVISQSNIWPYLEPDLLIYSRDFGLNKNSPEIFIKAMQAAQTDAEHCLYVGEDSWERLYATRSGMQVAVHPLLVRETISGAKVRFVRISPPQGISATQLPEALRGKPFVPMHITGRDRSQIIGLVATSLLSGLVNSQLEVEFLGAVDAPLLSDLYLLRDDRAARTGFLSYDGQSASFLTDGQRADWLVAATSEGMLVALPAGRSVEELHFEEANHGHNLKLKPNPLLLSSFDATLAQATYLKMDADISEELNDAELRTLSTLTNVSIEKYIGPYIGSLPIGDGGDVLRSRHIHHPDNERAVIALSEHFSAQSDQIRVQLHAFTHEGKRFFNVEAEIGPEAFNAVVLITAHLDSTAAFSPPYEPQTDSAVGADDDASGVAGVLAIAEIIANLTKVRALKSAVRFVLFNAEEHGLVGSKAYARDQAAIAAPISAVLQMDMIGYNVHPPRSWELHAGYWPSEEVQKLSILLAERVGRLAQQVSPELEPAQIYVSRGALPAERDPAEGRSDHAAFQEHGYSACVASEDFFAGPNANSPHPEGNPNYHQEGDTEIDAEYAADIARVIAAPAWVLSRET